MLINLMIHSHTLSNKKENYSKKKNNIYIISQNTKEQGIYIYIYNHKIPKNKEIL